MKRMGTKPARSVMLRAFSAIETARFDRVNSEGFTAQAYIKIASGRNARSI